MKNKLKYLKQGQAVYWVDVDWYRNPATVTLRKVFLHSQKTKLPPNGVVIDKYPVDFVQSFSGSGVFFSRRKAERELKRIRRINEE